MGFRDFKRQMKAQREQEETMRALNGAIVTLTRKRDDYAAKAKEALKKGNESQYRAMVALLKNAMFNLAQAEDMIANFTIARDMCEMQQLNKKFVHSLDNVMKNVYKTCKAIHVSNSEKTFMKALYQQNVTSMQLQQALKDNNSAFSASVNSISDISDEDVKDLIGEEIARDNLQMDDTLEALEREFMESANGGEKTAEPMLAEGMAALLCRARPDAFQAFHSFAFQAEREREEKEETPEDKVLNGEAGGRIPARVSV